MNLQPATPESLEQRVIDLIARHQRLRPGQITLDSTFVDLGVDSFDGMDLLLEFEQVFQVPIPDDIGRDVRTVRDAVVALRKALAAPAPTA
jgi:acyl carrier protein